MPVNITSSAIRYIGKIFLKNITKKKETSNITRASIPILLYSFNNLDPKVLRERKLEGIFHYSYARVAFFDIANSIHLIISAFALDETLGYSNLDNVVW